MSEVNLRLKGLPMFNPAVMQGPRRGFVGGMRDWLVTGPGKLQALRAVCREQGLILDDITSVQAAGGNYTGNEYRTYEGAISELVKKYEGEAEWGVLQTGNIVDVRAAFISAGGLKIFPKDKKTNDAKKEMEFVQCFLESNNLDHEMVQQYATEAELEGRFLAELYWDEKARMVKLRYISWADNKYTVKTAGRDYTRYASVSWSENSEPKKLEEESFAYARFAGRIHKIDKPYPKCAKCLTQIENLDKAIRDWREINSLFAAPVPDAEFKEAKDAAAAAVVIEKMNFKIRKAFVHTGTFSYKSPDMAGTDSLEREIITLAKMISGTTGTPVHFLGLPDLMSNRATAENLMELVSASTSKERGAWKGFYQQAITKAIGIWNDSSQKTKLDSSLLKVDIPYITQETWTKIEKVYLPLYLGRAISLQTLLSQLPDIDVDEELKRKEEADAQAMDRFSNPDDDEGEDEEDTDE